MSTLTIGTDDTADDIALLIRETPTDELLKLAEIFKEGHSPFELIKDELRHRQTHGDKLQSADQPEEIAALLSEVEDNTNEEIEYYLDPDAEHREWTVVDPDGDVFNLSNPDSLNGINQYVGNVNQVAGLSRDNFGLRIHTDSVPEEVTEAAQTRYQQAQTS